MVVVNVFQEYGGLLAQRYPSMITMMTMLSMITTICGYVASSMADQQTKFFS